MSESPDPVLCSFDPHSGIARITFNRPGAFNALDVAMAAAFEASTAWLLELEGLRCVVLQGAGKAFMTGGDVTAFAAPARS
jgi:2-(1,2-epoxy-1,2-dihydrophenyl)acetyl-CoA isomerase